MGDWSGQGRLDGGLDRARYTGAVGRLDGDLDGVPVFWTGEWTGGVGLERELEQGAENAWTGAGGGKQTGEKPGPEYKFHWTGGNFWNGGWTEGWVFQQRSL